VDAKCTALTSILGATANQLMSAKRKSVFATNIIANVTLTSVSAVVVIKTCRNFRETEKQISLLFATI
jgi:hypothetical protein